MNNCRVIGKSINRYDSIGKVTGSVKYTSDLFENCLFASVLRSQYHHAKIKHLDISEASTMPGVIKIITSKDIPGKKVFGRMIKDRPVLASNVVRHVGEPIAIVVANKPYEADNAISKIRIEFEILPYSLNVLDSLSEKFPKIHSNGNIAIETKIENGDIEKGFSDSEIIVEATLKTPRISPAYLETEAAVVEWHPDSSITVFTGSQNPFEERDIISSVLDIPNSKLNVVVPAIGGSFGGKCEADLSVLAALAAWLCKAKVRMVNSREESMVGHTKRHPAIMKYKIGAKEDGTIVALSANILLDSGAYAPVGPSVGAIVAEIGCGPYRIPNVNMVTRVIYTNSPPSGTIRSAGGSQAVYGIERMIDILADKLSIDPVAIRNKNIWAKGDITSFGVRINDKPPLEECLEHASLACEKLRKIPAGPGKICGVGVATSLLKMGLGYRIADDSTNCVEWKSDGNVVVHLGAPDLGQGLTTVAAQVTSEMLGIDYEQIEIKQLDTSTSPNGGPTITSRTTFLVGNSLIDACNDAIKVLLQFASEVLDIPKEDLSYQNGFVIINQTQKVKEIPVKYFAAKAREDNCHLIGQATSSFPYPEDTPDKYRPGMPHVMFIYGAQVARVEIDPEFGHITVTDIVSIHDVGKAINPKSIEGQIEGGVAMGIGYALYEDMKIKPNGSWTDNFLEYIMPTIIDMPNITSVILENKEKQGPFGAVGLGESVTVATAPAIVNAVRDATGIQFSEIPLDPCKVIENLYSKNMP